MDTGPNQEMSNAVTLRPVTRDSWRAVAELQVTEAQRAFVAAPSYYLALCFYEELWQPLAIHAGEQVVGFLMWAVDPADGSCWLGGILVDQQHQRRGYGRQAITAAIAMLAREHGHRHFALSYQPANAGAAALYRSLGFAETGEQEGDEVVARLELAKRPDSPMPN